MYYYMYFKAAVAAAAITGVLDNSSVTVVCEVGKCADCLRISSFSSWAFG